VAKLLQKRFDDPLFNQFSVLDWRYYQAMIEQDEADEEERLIRQAELVGIFVNDPAAGRRTRNEASTAMVRPPDANNKEITSSDGQRFVSTASDQDFIKTAKKMFG
jgi:hypothetical protein